MKNESPNILLVREECVPDSSPTATVAPVEGFTLQVQSIEGNADASRGNAAKKRKLIANAILIMMDSSSSESDDDEEIHLLEQLRSNDFFLFYNERNPRNCVKNYVEEIVPTYTEKEFRTHFRISRSLFESLSQRFLHSDYYKILRVDKRLSERVHLLVFLWFAGHEACSYRDLADRFNLALSAVCNIINRVTMFISSLSRDIIKWPTDEEKQKSCDFFNKKCYFSKAIGCIDGTHIRIDPPKRGKDEYIDRKGVMSISLQAICNEDKKFIYIFVGYPGSCHDSWAFKNSTIYGKLSSYCGDYYLLGDSAYPCNKFLVTPYRDNGHLTSAQKYYNIKLSSGRVAIEHAFGILKQRFRQLYYCKLRGMQKLCHFIRACCVLHNIASEDDLEFINEVAPETIDEIASHGEVSKGNYVRDPICQELQIRRQNT